MISVSVWVLGVGRVYFQRLLGFKTLEFHISNDSDNLSSALFDGHASKCNMTSQRTLIGKITLRHFLIYDRNRVRVRAIAFIKLAPKQKRNTHRFEITGHQTLIMRAEALVGVFG